MVTTQFSPRAFSGFLEDIFNGNANRFFKDDASHDEWVRNARQVPVNVKETEAGFTLDVIAPGIAKEDFKLQVNDKSLTISFEQKENENTADDKWLRKEYKVRAFKRTFTLGDKVDSEKITATYQNGILTLSLPKKEAAIATNKVIEVQ
jgi:HSP20 family protein